MDSGQGQHVADAALPLVLLALVPRPAPRCPRVSSVSASPPQVLLLAQQLVLHPGSEQLAGPNPGGDCWLPALSSSSPQPTQLHQSAAASVLWQLLLASTSGSSSDCFSSSRRPSLFAPEEQWCVQTLTSVHQMNLKNKKSKPICFTLTTWQAKLCIVEQQSNAS
jgi:hypothetical protein